MPLEEVPGTGLHYHLIAFDAEGRALLVRPRADGLRYGLALLARNEAWYRSGAHGSQVGFAAHEQHGDVWSADGSHFFDPLRDIGNGYGVVR